MWIWCVWLFLVGVWGDFSISYCGYCYEWECMLLFLLIFLGVSCIIGEDMCVGNLIGFRWCEECYYCGDFFGLFYVVEWWGFYEYFVIGFWGMIEYVGWGCVGDYCVDGDVFVVEFFGLVFGKVFYCGFCCWIDFGVGYWEFGKGGVEIDYVVIFV